MYPDITKEPHIGARIPKRIERAELEYATKE
jgi:hypothetical protein